MDRRGRGGLLIFAVLAAGVAAPAWANAGTPLMLAWGLHLMFGNAVIGVGEGLLIAWLFKASRKRVVILLVIANYVSMMAGQAIIFGFGRTPAMLDWLTIYTIPLALAWAVAAFYLLTILIEWPFCLFGLPKERRTAGRAFLTSLLVQTVSYAVLAIIYLKASFISLYTEGVVDASVVTETSNNATVYYISAVEDALCSVRIDGTECAKIAALPEEVINLLVRETDDGSACSLFGFRRDESEVLLVEGFCAPRSAAKRERGVRGWGIGFVGREEDGDDWEIYAGFWAAQGVRVRDLLTDEEYYLAIEAPFLSFRSRSPSLLPDDRAVYQLGDQIVLLDLKTRRLGLIARGSAPLVVMDEEGET